MITNEESKIESHPALQIEKPEQKGSEEPSTSVNTNASMPGSNPEKNTSPLTIEQ